MMQFEKKLLRREKNGNLRSLPRPQTLIDFSSNDYLGLARLPMQITNGVGSTGSRLLTGNSALAEELEERIASFHGYKAGLLFSCGYMANIGLLSAIASAEDTLLFDSEIHASIHDGIRLCKATAFAFKHNDLTHLEERLKKRSSKGSTFVCVESIYSTDGSEAPLVAICNLVQKYHAHLIVDEAHAVGIRGPEGRGIAFEYGLTEQIFAQVVTFGKALGTYGAIVLSKPIVKQAMINFARSYIYTTALPTQMLAAIKWSYDLFPTMQKERERIIQLSEGKSHIQSIIIPGNAKVKAVAQSLSEQGFDIRPLLSPTVQRGHERLRLSLHAFNTKEELSQCKRFLSQALEQM